MDSHLVAARLGPKPNLCLVRPAILAVIIPLLQQHRSARLHLLVHRQGVQYLVALQPVFLVHLRPPLRLAPPQLLELLHHQHLGILLRLLEHLQHLHLLVVSSLFVFRRRGLSVFSVIYCFFPQYECIFCL